LRQFEETEMNIDTGRIYTDPQEVAKARQRGERLVELSQQDYALLRGMNRQQRRRWASSKGIKPSEVSHIP
jgi:hypothetical protein